MKLNEAYNIMGLSPTANADEAKKQYRKLTKEFHPDINKDPGAEAKFKQINSAYEKIQSGQDEPEGFNPFEHTRQTVQVQNIPITITISFKESVFGCVKELKFKRSSKCANCNGQGEVQINNGCTSCGGRGQSVIKSGNSVFIQACQACKGRSATKACVTCNSNGTIQAEATVNVNIPGGIQNNNILRLQGMGNYYGNFMMFEQSSDVHLHVTVTHEPGLSINGNDVVSIITLSLSEALQGCNKEVKTVNGNKTIEIVPLSRHRDEVSIPKFGVNQIGAHKVILDVLYPKDTSKLIDSLKESET